MQLDYSSSVLGVEALYQAAVEDGAPFASRRRILVCLMHDYKHETGK